MSSCTAFRSQLLSVMDVLVQAAVAEICKLVDDGNALLRLQVSQSQEQNEVLKRKLHLMELMVARGRAGQLTGATSVPVDGYVSLMEDGGSKCVAKSVRQDPNFALHLIKQENDVEEDLGHSDCHEALGTGGKVAELPVEDGTKATPGQDRIGHSVWENPRLDSILKAEPENVTVNQSFQGKGSEQSAADPCSLDCEFPCEDSSCLNSFFTQQSTENKTMEGACCYATETASQNLPVSTDIQSVSEEWKVVDSCLSSPGSFSMKQGIVMMDSEPLKEEVDLNFEWDYSAISRTIHTHYEHCKEPTQGNLLHANMNTPLSPAINEGYTESKPSATDTNRWDLCNSGSATSVKTNADEGTEEEGLICIFCGESFTCQNVFEAHQRIHTGGKPFNCTHCDKTFAQLSNLIMHKRVHTGEKPYCCSHCGKQFAQSRYLVTHQRVHTGEKPFKCNQCGKKFAQSSNLIRHQSVHTGKKPFRCSQCGKCFTTSSHRKRHESVHYGRRRFPSAVQ